MAPGFLLTPLVVEHYHHLAGLGSVPFGVCLSAALEEGSPFPELIRKWLALLYLAQLRQAKPSDQYCSELYIMPGPPCSQKQLNYL